MTTIAAPAAAQDLLRLLTADPWVDGAAACLEALDATAFDADASPEEQSVAKSWCALCPVAAECYAAAVASADGPVCKRLSGTWGGHYFVDGVPVD